MITRIVLVALAASGLWLANYLFRPFLRLPGPAAMTCLSSEGTYRPLGKPGTVYGLGLSYAGHIAESPGLYDADAGPPVFVKGPRTLLAGETLPYPTRADLLAAASELDPVHAAALGQDADTIPTLLDYEVEVGLLLLDDVDVTSLDDPSFIPPLGYFVANDITARILLAMAPDVGQTVDYLVAGKNMAGFLAVGERAWVPADPAPDAGPCVDLVTTVNGERRQDSNFADIIVTPKEILRIVSQRLDLARFAAGDWIITGTPPGVAAQVPAWQQRLMVLVDPPASVKLRLMSRADASGRYLKPGDTVVVSAGHLGARTVRVR